MNFGFKIIENPALTDRAQVRFPRSRRKRIRKKWAANAGNFGSSPSKHFYKMKGLYGEDVLVCHPAMALELKRAIQAQDRDKAESDMYRRSVFVALDVA